MLEEKRNETEEASLSARASSPLSGRGSLIPKTQPSASRTTSGMPKGSWKQTSSYLARAKFGPPSSVRSSVSAHQSSRGPNSHKEVNERFSEFSLVLHYHLCIFLCVFCSRSCRKILQ